MRWTNNHGQYCNIFLYIAFRFGLFICNIPTSANWILCVHCITRFIVLTPLQMGLWPYWIKFSYSVYSVFSQIQWAATKSEKWNGKPRLECVTRRHPPSKTPVGWLPCPWHVGVKENDRALYTLPGKATLTSGLLLERSEALRSLRRYLRTQKRTSHHRSPGGQRHGKRKRSTIFLKGRVKAIVSQTNSGTVSKERRGNVRETGWGA